MANELQEQADDPGTDTQGNSTSAQGPPEPTAAHPDTAASPAMRFDEQANEAQVVENRLRMRNVNRMAILGLLAIVTAAMFPIAKLFFVPVVLAATFTTLLSPLYRRLLSLFGNRRGLSSFASCCIILVCLVAPTYVVVHLVVGQAIDLYHSAQPVVKDVLDKGGQSEFVDRIRGLPLVEKLRLANIDFSTTLNEGIKTIANVTTKVFNRTSSGIVEFLLMLFVLFFTMFYFFMDGEALLKRLKYLSPIRDDYEELIFSRFLLISRATVFGTVVIGVTQGTVGAIALLLFGIKLWLLWGFIMIILSIIPFLGAWMVLIPAGIVQIVAGHPWHGIGLILTSVLLVSTIDNLMRPRLVGSGAKLHDLIVFFSSLGGIAVFGVMGFIVGPVIAALFVAVLDIYSMEFEQSLKEAG
ncbi:MAG: AI-2E family transporter [Chitinispirillaceae bacterium]|nr:AI-2E family transporter [Chitinispirillaceae bacterium]